MVELNFPVPARTDKYTIHGKAYKIQFRGGTVVDIDNRNISPEHDPYLSARRDESHQGAHAHGERFVTDTILPLSLE